jgi:endonuclease YncB( thermonuclease family)/uncharacterized RDD family membrane protein YckC
VTEYVDSLSRTTVESTTLVELLQKESRNETESETQIAVCAETVSQARPWVRYWARFFDLFLFSFIVGVALAIFAPTVLEANELFLTFLIMQTWVFQESILLSTWGTTPGKWIFRIKVRDKNGNKLNLSSALGRSFSLWLKGFGLGIPILSFITLLTARSRLKKIGITTWDEQGGFVVTHYRIGAIRTTVAVLFFIGISLLAGWANALEEQQVSSINSQLQFSEQTSLQDSEKYHAKTFTVVNVVDGNTADVDVPDGKYEHTRIRLWGIDKPETKGDRPGVMNFGPQAAEFITKLTLGKPVTVYLDVANRTRDEYGRLLAYVQLPDGKFLNEVLVAEGFAYADLRFRHSFYNKYRQLEANARSQKKGLWQKITLEQRFQNE